MIQAVLVWQQKASGTVKQRKPSNKMGRCGVAVVIAAICCAGAALAAPSCIVDGIVERRPAASVAAATAINLDAVACVLCASSGGDLLSTTHVGFMFKIR